MVALIFAALALACAVAQPEVCEETVVVSADALLAVSHGVICFQCNVGGGIVPDASYTVGSSPVASHVGHTVDGVLVIMNSTSVFQTPTFVGCTSGGLSASAFVFLRVFRPPVISGNSSVSEGETLDLVCNASNSHPLTSVAWFSPQSLLLSDDRKLVVGNISRSQAGLYYCVATDLLSGATQTSTVAVTVTFAPEVMTLFSGVQFFPLGGRLQLSCAYEAVPSPPSTSWYHNSTLLTTSSTVSIALDGNSTTLAKTGLAENGGGNYTCAVENVVGFGTAEITVQIQLPPPSPLNLEVASSSAESLLLAWNIPEFTGYSSVAGVRVTVMENDSPSLISNRTLEGPAFSYHVTDLQPLQKYTLDVYIINEAGLEGEPATLSASTASLRLPAVEQLEVEVISSTELYLQWVAPVVNPSTTGPVQFYVVQYTSGSGTEGSTTVPGLNLTLGALEKGTNYTLSVAGVNQAGVGQARVNDSIQTAVDAPSPPQHFTAVPLSPFSLLLNWLQPTDSGGRPLQAYTLEVEVLVENSIITMEQLDARTTSAVLQNLVQNTTYILCLRAVNSVGLESGKVNATVATIPVGQPQVPTNVRVTNVTTETATVLWEEAGGYPDYYVLQYYHDNSTVMERLQVATHYHTITALRPLTLYTVTVASHNLNGVSDFSQDITFGTFGQVRIEGPTDSASGEQLSLQCTSGEQLSLQCTVESLPSSPSPLFVWSREGGALPQNSVVTNGTCGPYCASNSPDPTTGTLTLLEPSPPDTGVYVCSVAGTTQQISISICPKPQSNTTGDWVLVVSVLLTLLFLIFLLVVSLCCCIVWRRHYGQFDFERHKQRWELEMKS